jgi:hypothetical protein
MQAGLTYRNLESKGDIKMATLDKFLRANNACEDGYLFAKDLTLEEFLETCERGDWILWLFKRTNPAAIRELTSAKAHCANTVRHLMKDKTSLKAVDIALKFGAGKATRKDLDTAADAAYTAVGASYASTANAAYAAADADYATRAANAVASAASAADADYAANAYASSNAANAAANAAASAANAAASADADYVGAQAAYASADADYAGAQAAYAAAQAAYAAAKKKNQKKTADICRQDLPTEIWNQKEI